MKKLSIIVVVLVVLLIGGIAIVMQRGKESGSATTGMDSMKMDDSKKSNNNAEVDLTGETKVSIDIKSFAYSKPNIKIKKGTTVTWTNQDSIKHNVILEGLAKGAPTPSEVKPDVLGGPLLAKGETYSFTFNEVKSNSYICSPHPYMKGIVNVVE